MSKPNIMIMGNIAGAGKSTVAAYLTKKYGYYEITFASPIYEIAIDFFGMQKKDRKLLQDIGQKMREIEPLVWVNYAFNEAQLYQDYPIVISDVRQENEFNKGIEEGYLPLRICCGRDIAIQRIIKRDGFCDESKLDGPSEDGTRNLKVPEIRNDGTIEQLYKKIDEFMNSLMVD